MGGAFLDQIDNDRVEEKERLTREWRADCWKRVNPQMHAAEKRLAEFDEDHWFLKNLSERWASSISQLLEGVEKPYSLSLSELRKEMEPVTNVEIRLRMEKEVEDTEFRLNRGSDLGQFDLFWDDDSLFDCRYSRSKWLHLSPYFQSAPLEFHLHALKRNKNIIHVTFGPFESHSDVNQIQATVGDIQWVTSISFGTLPTLPAIHRDLLFIKSIDNDLITFTKEIRPKLDSFSTYIFTDAGSSDITTVSLMNDARVLISFVAPTSGQSLTLRLKHSGRREDAPLECTLGTTMIQLNPSGKLRSTLTIDDITLYPHSESGHLSFEPEIRNDIVVQFQRTVESRRKGHFLHDIELLDEAGLEYRSQALLHTV